MQCIIVSVRALNSFMLLAATWLNNTKGANFYVLKKHFQYFLMVFTVIHVTQLYTEEALLLFPWQQWLHECATLLRYTFIVCVLYYISSLIGRLSDYCVRGCESYRVPNIIK